MSWTSNGQGQPWHRIHKPSPPLAIKALDPKVLEGWMTSLIKRNLEDVGDMYYWEGSQVRTDMLQALCSMYDALRNDKHVSD